MSGCQKSPQSSCMPNNHHQHGGLFNVVSYKVAKNKVEPKCWSCYKSLVTMESSFSESHGILHFDCCKYAYKQEIYVNL